MQKGFRVETPKTLKLIAFKQKPHSVGKSLILPACWPGMQKEIFKTSFFRKYNKKDCKFVKKILKNKS